MEMIMDINLVKVNLDFIRNGGHIEIKSRKSHQSTTHITQSNLTNNRIHEKIVTIFSENIYTYNGEFFRTGLSTKEVGCTHFLDLFSACTNLNTRNLLAKLLHKKLKEIESSTGRFDFIAVPKLGNTLLVDALCQFSKKPLLIVRTKPKSIKFKYPVEGNIQSGKNVLLVDDIGSDGKFIYDAILVLRECGARVDVVICIVNRTDGDAEKILNAHDLSYYYVYNLNDAILQKVTRG
jgi:orotate phosphoribosyltransferase